MSTYVKVRLRGGDQRVIGADDTREGESWQQCANRLYNTGSGRRASRDTVQLCEKHAPGLYLVQFGHSLAGSPRGSQVALGPQCIVYVTQEQDTGDA